MREKNQSARAEEKVAVIDDIMYNYWAEHMCFDAEEVCEMNGGLVITANSRLEKIDR